MMDQLREIDWLWLSPVPEIMLSLLAVTYACWLGWAVWRVIESFIKTKE